MSVDLLQEKIRKLKNPSMIELAMEQALVPQSYIQAHGSFAAGWSAYCRELLDACKETVPAVRLSVGSCSAHGAAGLQAMEGVLAKAKELDYYVVLDVPQMLSPVAAKSCAAMFAESGADGAVICPWLGSDVLRPFAQLGKEGKSVFTVVRSGNKTAFELQDLLSGSRLVHVAAADLVNRHGESLCGKFGYSQMAALVGATVPNTIKSLRAKYSRMFFLVGGLEYSGANFKNCSYAFDKYGRGAVVCAGSSVMGAWSEDGAPADPVEAAVQAADRMKKNLSRYISIL